MRIVYLSQSYHPMISGAAIVAEQLAKEMAERGHQILVIAASDREQPYLSLQKNLTILRLKSIRNPMRVGQRFLIYPRSAVMTALHKFKPDIIHGHEPLLCWIGFAYARQMNISTTLTMHMLPWFVAGYLPRQSLLHRVAERASWMYFRIFARNFTSIITTTKTASETIFKKTGMHHDMISCGIDMRMFHPPLSPDVEPATRTRLNLPSNIPVILHVGRLDPEKNVDRILQAAALTMRQSEAHLLIVGDGREKSSLMKLSHTLGITDRTHFSGYLSAKDGLPDIYRMANLFVMASEIESQGLVLLEAAASGLPLVAVDATSIHEIVHEGVNGYLAKPGDVHSLANAMTTLLNNPETAQQMGRESYTLAKQYDLQTVCELHEQLYDKLIKGYKAETRTPASSWKRVKTWMGFSK
jgi:glycosyltransferase involved in cell wall biosynthesis